MSRCLGEGEGLYQSRSGSLHSVGRRHGSAKRFHLLLKQWLVFIGFAGQRQTSPQRIDGLFVLALVILAEKYVKEFFGKWR